MSEPNVADARPLSQFLRVAVMAGVERAVQIHIDRGDDLNARDPSGMTPLMLSAARNKPAICRLLLSAGADRGLLDPSGKTALEIAVAAGSKDAAAILSTVHASTPSFGVPEIAPDPEPLQIVASPPIDGHFAREVTPDAWPSASVGPRESEGPGAEPESVAPHSLVIEIEDSGGFDLSGWEIEEETVPPEGDLIVLGLASAVQIAITAHDPIDSSAGWDDIEAYLPEQALPLARADDAEGRSRLRLLLLRAIREGSVPRRDVLALSTNDDCSANLEAEAFLAMVVNDLGAEVDERFEYADVNENFEVFVDPEETPEEEADIDHALTAIDCAASPRHEPLRIYQREFQRLRLLTTEEEIELAQAMESALEAALDALASWPTGIAQTLAAGAEVIAGTRPASSIWLGDAEQNPDRASADTMDVDAAEAGLTENAMDEVGEPIANEAGEAGDADFADALHRLSSLVERGVSEPLAIREIRLVLAALRLNRRFLLELGDAATGPTPCPAFGCALAAFRKARDRMAESNLKLAFFHAKKYLYSGEPLDDLAQEANIGLLKAVDRYDWRRGYRFSTYATWWIRQQIGRHVADKARTIRLPVHVYEKTQRIERAVEALETASGHQPTIDEIAARVEIPARKVAALQRMALPTLSIEDLSVDDMLAVEARDVLTPLEPSIVVETAELAAAVDAMLSSLPDKDAQIIRLRFGFGGNEALTLEEIGQRYEVTRERIRQIEAKAMKKLKHPARAEPFARLALGIQLPQQSPARLAEEVDVAEEDDGSGGDGAAETTSQQRRPATAVQPPSNTASPAPGSKVNRILADAGRIGVHVDDDRSGSSGRIWVNLPDSTSSKHRRLARQLLESGFKFWPGKGYWR